MPDRDPLTKTVVGLLTPVVLRLGFGAIMAPSRADQLAMGIPDEVIGDVFRRDPLMKKVRRDVCADVRMLCEEVGVLTPLTRWAGRRWAWTAGRPVPSRAGRRRLLRGHVTP